MFGLEKAPYLDTFHTVLNTHKRVSDKSRELLTKISETDECTSICSGSMECEVFDLYELMGGPEDLTLRVFIYKSRAETGKSQAKFNNNS